MTVGELHEEGGEVGGRNYLCLSHLLITRLYPLLYPAPKSSVITEVFEGLLESTVKCSECKKVSVTKETFQDLSLPIPGQSATFSLPLSSSLSPFRCLLLVSLAFLFPCYPLRPPLRAN